MQRYKNRLTTPCFFDSGPAKGPPVFFQRPAASCPYTFSPLRDPGKNTRPKGPVRVSRRSRKGKARLPQPGGLLRKTGYGAAPCFLRPRPPPVHEPYRRAVRDPARPGIPPFSASSAQRNNIAQLPKKHGLIPKKFWNKEKFSLYFGIVRRRLCQSRFRKERTVL